MKNYCLLPVALLLLFTLVAKRTTASHALASNIYYEIVGQDSFLIRVNIFRDCTGISAPQQISMNVFGCGTSYSLTLTRPSTITPENYPNGTEISPWCYTYLPNTVCKGGNLLGVEHYQYTGLWAPTIATTCAEWKLSFEEIARNARTTNISNASMYGLYLEATIKNTNGIRNTSPRFTAAPVPFFCYQDRVSYNLGTIDEDGDSLVYTLIQPMQGNGVAIPYLTGYSTTNPVDCNNSFLFDRATGQLSFVPTQAQVGVITINIDEYRNGVWIGSTMHDMELIVLGAPFCSAPYPALRNDGIPISTTGGHFASPYHFEVCPGDTLRFTIGFHARYRQFATTFVNAIPNSTIRYVFSTQDSIVAEFTFPSTVNDIGQKHFSVGVGSAECPFIKWNYQTFYIDILKGVDAGADVPYCNGGLPVQLEARGGSSFTWSPANGLSSTSIRNPIATPTTTTDYIVQSNLSGTCKNIDTVRVTSVPSFTWSLTPATDTISFCTNNLAFLGVQADTTFAPYSYNWSPSTNLSSTNTANTIASPGTSTTYVVTVTSNTGCTNVDSVHINITGVGPKVTAVIDSATICAGDTVQLDARVNYEICGPSVGSGSCTSGNSVANTVGTGSVNSNITPFTDVATDARYQVLYLARDLRAAGMTSGTISKIGLTIVNKQSTVPIPALGISIGCTDATSLTTAQWLPATTQVYSANSYTTIAGVNEFVFSQNYDWDGESNLVLEFCFGDTSNYSIMGSDVLLSTNVPYLATMQATYIGAANGCTIPVSAITSNPSAQVPNIVFHTCDAGTVNQTYQWTPTAGLSNPNILNPVATPVQSTTYVLTVNDSVCSGQAMTAIHVNRLDITVTNDTALCSSDTVQLNVPLPPFTTLACGYNNNNCIGNTDSIVVGTGTVFNTQTTYPTPYGHYYESSRQQYLYTATDLLAAGVTPGRLKGLAFQIMQRNGTANYHNFSIRIKCTSTGSFNQPNLEDGDFVTVFNPKQVVLTHNGWLTHSFDNSFDWDGTSNLIVEICFSNYNVLASFTSNTQIYSTTTPYISSAWHSMDGADACAGASNGFAIEGSSTSRPNIKLYTCAPGSPYTVVWSPATGLSDAYIENPIAVPTTSTTYSVQVTDMNGCTTIDSVSIAVGDSSHVSITSNPSNVCAGNATFTAFPVNGGNASYQWKLNGNNVGGNSATLTLNNLTANDEVYCIMTSSLTCLSNNIAVSNVIEVNAADTTIMSVSISSNTSPVCPGTSTITAIAANAGSNPTYQWQLNGNNIGSNTTTVSINNLAEGDVIYCIVTSSIACNTQPVDTSNSITVSPVGSPQVTVTANPSPACADATIDFTATVLNGGNPTYEWLLNGNYMGNTPTLQLSNLNTGDRIYCTISSSLSCVPNPVVTSNIITVSSCVGIAEVIPALDIQVMPNPSNGMFYLSTNYSAQDWNISVYDLAGKAVTSDTHVATSLQQYPLNLSALAKGVYILRVGNAHTYGYKRLVVQ